MLEWKYMNVSRVEEEGVWKKADIEFVEKYLIWIFYEYLNSAFTARGVIQQYEFQGFDKQIL